MDILTPLAVGIVLATLTGNQAWMNKGRFDKQDERLDRLEARIDRRFDRLASENAAIRSDLTQIALALGLRARPETG